MPITNDYTVLSNEKLTEEVHRLASAVSYYNAAEGNWYMETAARNACQAQFRAAMNELESRGIEFENRGYLL
jgi:hypothetical protein